MLMFLVFFILKKKTAYELRISDWISDVCSSDLDLNRGTASGASCSPALQARLEAVLAAQSRYDWVANGRFKGGYITRHYGAPADGIDAVQLEISQRIYKIGRAACREIVYQYVLISVVAGSLKKK